MILLEAKRLLTGKKFMMEIDVTDRCNLHCSHCYHAGEVDDHEPSLEQWRAFFAQQRSKGVRCVLLVGGEPTLRWDVMAEALKQFSIVDVITNGTIKIPEDAGMRIFLSLDGDKMVNDRIRGAGSFKKALDNYHNDGRVIINMTLTAENYLETESLIQLALQNNFAGLTCNIITPNCGKSEPEKLLDPLIRHKIVELLHQLKRRYPRTLLLSRGMIQWYRYPDHRKKCYWRKHVVHFDSHFKSRYCFSDLDCSQCGCYAGASLSSRFFW